MPYKVSVGAPYMPEMVKTIQASGRTNHSCLTEMYHHQLTHQYYAGKRTYSMYFCLGRLNWNYSTDDECALRISHQIEWAYIICPGLNTVDVSRD